MHAQNEHQLSRKTTKPPLVLAGLLLALSATRSAAAEPLRLYIEPPAPLHESSFGRYTATGNNPCIATNGTGVWIVLVTASGPGGPTMLRSVDDGATWSDPVELPTSGLGSDGFGTSITHDGNGTWMVVFAYTQCETFSTCEDVDIYYSMSADDGLTWTEAALLNNNGFEDGRDDQLPDVAGDGEGNWVAIWDSEDSLGGTIGEDWDVLVSHSHDDGRTWSDPAPITPSAYDENEPAPNATWNQNANIATDGRTWVATWTDTKAAFGKPYVVRSVDAGRSWSAPQQLTSSTGNDLDLATDGLGTFIIAFTSGSNAGVFRSFDNAITWSEFDVIQSTDGYSRNNVAIETDGHGNWVLLVATRAPLGKFEDDYDIVIRRSFDDGTTWSEFGPLNTNAEFDFADYPYDDSGSIAAIDYRPKLATDGEGQWVCVWHTRTNVIVGGQSTGWTDDSLTTRFRMSDCNVNGLPDEFETRNRLVADCDANGMPDSCDPDENFNGIVDACEPPDDPPADDPNDVVDPPADDPNDVVAPPADDPNDVPGIPVDGPVDVEDEPGGGSDPPGAGPNETRGGSGTAGGGTVFRGDAACGSGMALAVPIGFIGLMAMGLFGTHGRSRFGIRAARSSA